MASKLIVVVAARQRRADTCAQRISEAQSSIRASLASADAARERLEAAIEQTSSDGVPVKAMSEDDSMAVEMQDAKRDQQEAITRTERSRRAHTTR